MSCQWQLYCGNGLQPFFVLLILAHNVASFFIILITYRTMFLTVDVLNLSTKTGHVATVAAAHAGQTATSSGTMCCYLCRLSLPGWNVTDPSSVRSDTRMQSMQYLHRYDGCSDRRAPRSLSAKQKTNFLQTKKQIFHPFSTRPIIAYFLCGGNKSQEDCFCEIIILRRGHKKKKSS